ncbi:acetyl-CoA synthetase-like protein [Lentithecium fluviatile CBS 122367]|uniref:Acetyl-CoA synthetase-like protein n=1 Tax=Lentithecium fluviatile CBS 122367 TaxID=1168545 RepID=A0A6G1IUU7_9PLEO|nr:acetyl-CoA synthetase-like protein [Lentithecium fluviatile CBS 122367]
MAPRHLNVGLKTPKSCALTGLAPLPDPRTPRSRKDGPAPVQHAPQHLRVRRAPHPREIRVDDPLRRQRAAGALRHNRSRHGPLVRPLLLGPRRRVRGLAAPRRGSAPRRHGNRGHHRRRRGMGRGDAARAPRRDPAPRTIFREYWRNPEATAREFVDGEDGMGKWFRTGDVAVRRAVARTGGGESGQGWAKGGMYFILGRKSADIIKTGGEKVSALEIEREMLSLPQVAEVAVVGLDSEAWGQKVACVVVLSETGRTGGRGGRAWGAMDMRRALKDLLANYKIPQEMRVVERIPRNAMGKVNKKGLVREVWGEKGRGGGGGEGEWGGVGAERECMTMLALLDGIGVRRMGVKVLVM